MIQSNGAWAKFGAEVRRLRLNLNLSQDELASVIHSSRPLISGYERGTRKPKRDMVGKLDQALDGGGQLIQVWADIRKQQMYPNWMADFIEAERQASMIREYSLAPIPGLLQTEEYCRTILQDGNSFATADRVEESVQGRLRRQKIWDSPAAPSMVAIVNEWTVNVPVGSAQIMTDQLTHLIEMTGSHSIRVQVIPNDACRRPGRTGSFILLTLPSDQDLLYVENAVGGTMVHDTSQVRRLALTFGDLQGAALSPERSLDLLHVTRKGLDSERS